MKNFKIEESEKSDIRMKLRSIFLFFQAHPENYNDSEMNDRCCDVIEMLETLDKLKEI